MKVVATNLAVLGSRLTQTAPNITAILTNAVMTATVLVVLGSPRTPTAQCMAWTLSSTPLGLTIESENMAVLKDFELYVVTHSAAYVGLSMVGSEVYTDKTEAEAAMETQKKANNMMADSGFKFAVMSLDDYVREYASQRYQDGMHEERNSRYD